MPEILYTKEMIEWYDSLYCRSENTKAQIKFLKNLFKKNKVKKIIDVPCGTGRHAIELSKIGFSITGIDKGKTMVKYAKNKAEKCGVKVKFIVQDMQKIKLKEKFDAAIIMYGSLAYLTSNESILKCLLSIKNNLKKNGIVIIEDDNPWQDIVARRLTTVYKIKSADRKMIVRHKIKVHKENNLMEIMSSYERYIKNKKLQIKADKRPIILRIFSKNELELILTMAGFKNIKTFGNFSGKKFSSKNYKKIIMTAFKA